MARAQKKDYAAIAARKITTPTQMKVKYRRLFVYGRNKKGKTKFCMSAPDVLVIDPEHGTDEFIKENPQVWPVESWADIDEVYKYIKSEKHDYKWLALDGLTKINSYALRWVMRLEEERNLERRPGMVDRRDYAKSGELVKGLLLNLHALPINLIITAQERMTEGVGAEEDDSENAENVTMFVPDLPKGVRSQALSMASVIGRIYTVRTTEKYREKGSKKVIEIPNVVQRRLWLESHPQYDTGYRSDHKIPSFLPKPTVPRLVKLIETGATT